MSSESSLKPKIKSQLTSSRTLHGTPVLPHQHVQLMSSAVWEEFIGEWANTLKPATYERIEHIGGAGDSGLDVRAFLKDDLYSPWDNFQCKHYDHPLQPNEVWAELGKFIYYAWKGEFTIPRVYYFCAPHDVGTSLSKLLKNPEGLRTKLIENWTKYCEKKITAEKAVLLEGDFREFVEAFSFRMFTYKPVADLIEQHRKSPFHVTRFGGGLPDREEPPKPPIDLATNETVYVGQLFQAYSEHIGSPIECRDDLTRADLVRHLEKSRREFFCAEGLRKFSEDNLPANEFERLQNDIHGAVVDIVDELHADGLARAKATVRHAHSVAIDSHALKDRMMLTDRAGVCHQLVNNGVIEWVKK